jgi:uncharacterized protein YqeY
VNIKQQINENLKAAMLAGDKTLTTTLRGIKSVILDAEISQNKRETGLSEEETRNLLRKEAKKRQESADLFKQGGNQEKADAESAEKTVIEKYLPAQMDEESVAKLVDEVIAGMGEVSQQQMGQIIGQAKNKSQGQADGALIAKIVKERLS